MQAPIALGDRRIVDAGEPPPHQPFFVKLPELVPIGPVPLARIVMPFILEGHGHAIVPEAPQRLLEAVVELAGPFSSKERFDRVTSLEELGAVSPLGVLG